MARRSIFVGSENLSGISFLGVERRIEERLRAVIETLTNELHGKAQASLTGGALGTRTGKLLRSLQAKVWHRPGVKVGGLVKQRERTAWYGRLWERGHTRHGPAPGPSDLIEVERPFLRPAFDSMRADIRARLTAVVKAAAQGGAA